MPAEADSFFEWPRQSKLIVNVNEMSDTFSLLELFVLEFPTFLPETHGTHTGHTRDTRARTLGPTDHDAARALLDSPLDASIITS